MSESPATQENWIGVNGRSVRYLVYGDGKPMVMVHGYNFNANDWINCCGNDFPGFKIYALDMPYGLGRGVITSCLRMIMIMPITYMP